MDAGQGVVSGWSWGRVPGSDKCGQEAERRPRAGQGVREGFLGGKDKYEFTGWEGRAFFPAKERHTGAGVMSGSWDGRGGSRRKRAQVPESVAKEACGVCMSGVGTRAGAAGGFIHGICSS